MNTNGRLRTPESILLIGLDPREEAAVRGSVRESPYWTVAGSCRTYGEALTRIGGTHISMAVLSCRPGDMSVASFLELTGLFSVFLIPEEPAGVDLISLAVDSVHTGKIINFMRAPADRRQLDQVYRDLLHYRAREDGR